MTSSSSNFDAPAARYPTSDSMLAVHISPDLTRFQVDKDLLMEHSLYFLREIGFHEDLSKIPLQDVEESTFQLFLEWLHTQKLPDPSLWFEKFTYIVDDNFFGYLADVYAFAYRYEVPALRDYIMKTTTDYAGEESYECIDYDNVVSVFKSLNKDDPYLQLVADIFCSKWTEKFHKEMEKQEQDVDKLPGALLLKIMIKFTKLRAREGTSQQHILEETPKQHELDDAPEAYKRDDSPDMVKLEDTSE